MSCGLVKVGGQVLNVSAVAAAHWEDERLFVHFLGGRFVTMRGDDAAVVWQAILKQVEVIELPTAVTGVEPS